jgi:hypothetical protein
MFKKFKLMRQFKKEVNKDLLYREAVAWTKAHFKKRGVPNWTSEYQNTFAAHTLKYCQAYLHAYAKRRYNEHLAEITNPTSR